LAGFASLGHVLDGEGVGLVSGEGLGFAEVDVVEGGGVDDGVGFLLVEHGGELLGVGNVEFVAAGEGEEGVAAGGEEAGEIGAELSGGADEGDDHVVLDDGGSKTKDTKSAKDHEEDNREERSWKREERNASGFWNMREACGILRSETDCLAGSFDAGEGCTFEWQGVPL
jgi:hypothetical protein